MKSQPSKKNGGEGTFAPKFDAQGLLTAVAVDSSSGEILMVAHMNREALEATRRNRKATFFSRSRNKLWVKGETSGNFLEVEEIRIDCDQDCVLLRVRLPAGGAACHTGSRSCFYRRWKLTGSGELEAIQD
ncbi:MAG: phosphoribosyl-AMP cyclohydrolase [Verrucomicrobia bacterium]|nr:phosphoribosyl-AMP cyclohydrolase [Verrucomicrobiota bacterium]